MTTATTITQFHGEALWATGTVGKAGSAGVSRRMGPSGLRQAVTTLEAPSSLHLPTPLKSTRSPPPLRPSHKTSFLPPPFAAFFRLFRLPPPAYLACFLPSYPFLLCTSMNRRSRHLQRLVQRTMMVKVVARSGELVAFLSGRSSLKPFLRNVALLSPLLLLTAASGAARCEGGPEGMRGGGEGG